MVWWGSRADVKLVTDGDGLHKEQEEIRATEGENTRKKRKKKKLHVHVCKKRQ